MERLPFTFLSDRDTGDLIVLIIPTLSKPRVAKLSRPRDMCNDVTFPLTHVITNITIGTIHAIVAAISKKSNLTLFFLVVVILILFILCIVVLLNLLF